MAIVMALTCFSGVMTSFAASKDVNYYDKDVYYNSLGWNILSDEQTATALLDYLDAFLAENSNKIYDLLAAKLPSSGLYYYNPTNREIKVDIASINIGLNLDSVDGLITTVANVQRNISGISYDLIGEASKLRLTATAGMSRANTSSCDILKGILGLIQQNIAYFEGTKDSEDLIGKVLRGQFNLGMLNGAVDVYGIIKNALGLEDEYQKNLVYNIVKTLLFNYTGWFTDAEIAGYKSNPSSFKLDAVLLDKMSSELLSKININITYPDGTSSQSRYKEMQEYVTAHGGTLQNAATALGYDPNLVYSEENAGNVLLFEYGYGSSRQHLTINTNTTLLNFGYQALDLAWKTALSPTIKLIHVNDDNWTNNAKGSNFDNVYYYWANENTTWSQTNLASNYTAEKLNQWANSTVKNEDGTTTTVYASHGFKTAQEFLDYVKSTLTYDRTEVENAKGNWRDIDATTLFNKLRYSPLADYGFNMQTGPINLYFMQTGTPNLDSFFRAYANGDYTSMVGSLNNVLVAAVRDFFPSRDNIYKETKGDSLVSNINFYETDASINKATSFNTATMKTLSSKIVENALKVVQHTADTTDRNILAAFYKANGTTAALSEQKLEATMIPLLVACIGQINLGHGKLNELVHPEDWDSCKDAEGVMFICLQEYLSYILPDRDYEGTFTKNGAITLDNNNQLNVDFDKAILPMARDALAYILSPLVPISYNGVAWRLTDKTNFDIDSKATVYDLLNSVICYYADDFTLVTGKGIGIASLLGLCDTNGESLINTDNTIWQNIDIAVNKLLPVGGVLQTGDANKRGQADSKDLIYNDLICGIKNIGEKRTSDLYGTSNIIYRLLVLVTAPPLSSDRLEISVYNLLADLLNALFGKRYNGQIFDNPVPRASANQAYPFDDLLQVGTLAGTDSQTSKVGVIQKLIYNFVEASGMGRRNGTGSLSTSAYNDSIIRGLMFILTSVNSFVDIFPSLSNHEFNMATASLGQSVAYGLASGEQITTDLLIKNNSAGINNAYVDSNGNPQRLPRYAIYLKDVVLTSTAARISKSGFMNGTTLETTTKVNEVIMPSEFKKLTFVGGMEARISNLTNTITYKYDVLHIDESGNVDISKPIYSDLTGVTYQYLTAAKSWKDTVYPAGRNGEMDTSLEGNSANASLVNSSGNTAKTSATFGSNNALIFNYPDRMVTSLDSLSSLPDLKVRVKNTAGSAGSFSGWYVYDEKSVLNDATNTMVTVGKDNAIPVFDKSTGALINPSRSDYSTDGGKTWNTGTGNVGYTDAEIQALIEKNTSTTYTTRTHIAYTFDQAKAQNIIAAYHKEGNNFEYIYLKQGSVNYATLLSQVAMRGPVDGLYLSTYNSSDFTVDANGAKYYSLFNYQSGATVAAGNYDVKLNLYASNGSRQISNFSLLIGDDSAASSLQNKYQELSNLVANFRKDQDFSDTSVYDYAVTALQDTLKTLAEPLTPTTAAAMNDTKVLRAQTYETTNSVGDIAYVPCTNLNSIPLAMRNSVYHDTATGCYYLDPAFTIPVYSNTLLTSTGVTNGKDKAGVAVVEGSGDNAGKFFYVNAVAHDMEWTNKYGTPYLEETENQRTNNYGVPLYDAVRYEHRDANNNIVAANENWVIKIPMTYSAIKRNDTNDYRGTYTKAVDYLDYAIDNLSSGIQESVKNKLFNEVSLVREGMNTNDYDAVSYKAMTDYAKSIENLYTITLNYTDNKTGVSNEVTVPYGEYTGYVNNGDLTIHSQKINCSVSSIQAEQYVQMFNNLITHVTERGYIGNQLEAEILCASGNAYNDMTAVKPVVDEETGAVTTNGTVKVSAAAAAPRFGAIDADGNLVNAGKTVYTEESWNNYINALANAVYLANYAHSDAYKAYAGRNYFVPADKEKYTAQVSDVYFNDATLQRAENMLEEFVEKNVTITVADAVGGYVTVNGSPYTSPVTVSTSTDVTVEAVVDPGYTFAGFQIGDKLVTENPYTVKFNDDTTITPVFEKAQSDKHSVSGSLVVAIDYTGKTANKAAYGEYTMTVYSDAARTAVVDTFTSTYDDAAKTNTFDLALADGTYYATLSYEYALTREDITITVSGADIADVVIPVIACNFFNTDTSITINDTRACQAGTLNSEGKEYCDLNADGMVTVNDTRIVQACALGTPALEPIDIK